MPQVRHNRIGIDTGAYLTDRLACLVLRVSEPSRKMAMAMVETSGRTSAKSSPVAGRTAAKITSTAWLERSVCGREGRLGVI